MLRRLLCRLGFHAYDARGGHCTRCGKCDDWLGLHFGCGGKWGDRP